MPARHPRSYRTPRNKTSSIMAGHATSSDPDDTADNAKQFRGQVAALVTCTAKLTAPCMIYNSGANRIITNPQYDRRTMTKVASIQGTLLRMLREARQRSAVYTPKELLYELERAVWCMCASAATLDDVAPSTDISKGTDASPSIPLLEALFANRNASPMAVVTVAYILSHGASAREVDSFLVHLDQRVSDEEDPAIARHRNTAAQKALQGTRNNLHDFMQLRTAMSTSFHVLQTAAQGAGSPLGDGTATLFPVKALSSEGTASLLQQLYYGLLGWLVTVDPDRLALHHHNLFSHDFVEAGRSTVPTGARFAESLTSCRVTAYDPLSGRVSLRRPSGATRWGLLFNAHGLLIGLENELRNASVAGERLHTALQWFTRGDACADGVPVLQVNGKRVQAGHHLDEKKGHSTRKQAVIHDVVSLLSQATTEMHLVLGKHTTAAGATAHEVLFELAVQGGENSTGQRVLLLLRRPSLAVPWGLTITTHASTGVWIREFSDRLHLSAEAKNFMFDNRNRLQVLQVNSHRIEAQPDQGCLRDVVGRSTLLLLQLQVGKAAAEGLLVPDDAEEVVIIAADDSHGTHGVKPVEERTECVDRLDQLDSVESEVMEEQPAVGTEHTEHLAEDAWATVRVPVADESFRVALGDDSVPAEGNKPLASEEPARLAVPASDAPAARGKAVRDSSQEKAPVTKADMEGAEDEEAAAAYDRALLQQHRIPADDPLPLFDGEPGEAVMEAAKDDLVPAERDSSDAVNAAVVEALAQMEAADALLPEVTTAMTPKRKKPSRKGSKTPRISGEGRPSKNSEAVAASPVVTPESAENVEELVAAEMSLNSTWRDLAKKQDVLEEPLVELLPPSLDAGRKTSAKRKKKLVMEANPAPQQETEVTGEGHDVATDEVSVSHSAPTGESASVLAPDSGVSPDEISRAPPLRFSNQVKMKSFDGKTLEFQRGSLKQPWDIAVTLSGTDVVVTKLPPASKDALTHPYMRHLQADEAGRVSLAVDRLNGKSVSAMSASMKVTALEAIRKSTKLSVSLRSLRK